MESWPELDAVKSSKIQQCDIAIIFVFDVKLKSVASVINDKKNSGILQ